MRIPQTPARRSNEPFELYTEKTWLFETATEVVVEVDLLLVVSISFELNADFAINNGEYNLEIKGFI